MNRFVLSFFCVKGFIIRDIFSTFSLTDNLFVLSLNDYNSFFDVARDMYDNGEILIYDQTFRNDMNNLCRSIITISNNKR